MAPLPCQSSTTSRRSTLRVDAPPLTIAERDLGVGRRLANLGSGRKELETDPVARRAAVAAFQRSFRTAANATGAIDAERVRRLAATDGDTVTAETPP